MAIHHGGATKLKWIGRWMLRNILIKGLLQPYWRLTRSQTLGVQGIVVEGRRRILLVRHSYVPGWHFPGGGVERDEACEVALERELIEEAGIKMHGEPHLHGIFANFKRSKGDHILVYLVEEWERIQAPLRSLEIVERKFFELNLLPGGLIEGARRRLAEVFSHQPRSNEW
jgi:ADP-ribose pyrophosphatase YjhB (NUDIX family)